MSSRLRLVFLDSLYSNSREQANMQHQLRHVVHVTSVFAVDCSAMRYSSDFSAGSAYVAVVFLLIGVGSCQAAGTAYLLGSLQRSNPANHTYRTLAEVINPPHSGVYDNIVLLGNYTNTQGPNLVVSNRNLSITSAPGNFFTFDLNFITGDICWLLTWQCASLSSVAC